VVMKAVKKFKKIALEKRPELMEGILGRGVRIVRPPASIDKKGDPPLQHSRSMDLSDRRAIESALASEGVHRDIDLQEFKTSLPLVDRLDTAVTHTDKPSKQAQHTHKESRHHSCKPVTEGITPVVPSLPKGESTREKGHAHDPMDEEPLFLGIGSGGHALTPSVTPPPQDVIADSPTAAEFNIYDTAYQNEVERIRSAQGHQATVYLTRRVDSKKEYRADENMINAPKASEVAGQPHAGWKALIDNAREKHESGESDTTLGDQLSGTSQNLMSMVSQASENAKVDARSFGRKMSDKGSSAITNMLQKAMDRSNTKAENSEEK